MSKKSKDKTDSVLFYVSAVIFYVASILNFFSNDAVIGVTNLCLGSTFLCLGSVTAKDNKSKKSNKTIKKKGKKRV